MTDYVHNDGYFDSKAAAEYDDPDSPMFSSEHINAVVGFLAEHAGEGPVLEFGIGTGRIALPLANRGVDVAGVDMSQAMIKRLQAKDGGKVIRSVIGDLATTKMDGKFTLVYLIFNTIMNLTTQEQQVACFRNAAEHLAPGGVFVIEVMTPELSRLSPGNNTVVFDSSGTGWGLDEYDVANQALISHHLNVVDGGLLEPASIPFRYVWPAELDLMAQLAGMTLRERWGGWSRQPFGSESKQHISVWELPADR